MYQHEISKRLLSLESRRLLLFCFTDRKPSANSKAWEAFPLTAHLHANFCYFFHRWTLIQSSALIHFSSTYFFFIGHLFEFQMINNRQYINVFFMVSRILLEETAILNLLFKDRFLSWISYHMVATLNRGSQFLMANRTIHSSLLPCVRLPQAGNKLWAI